MLTALDLFVFVFNIYVSSIKELKNFMCVLGLLLNNNNKKGSWAFVWFTFTHIGFLNILKSRDRYSTEIWQKVPRYKIGKRRRTLDPVGWVILPVGQDNSHVTCYRNAVSGAGG